jgi:hypothetical protein
MAFSDPRRLLERLETLGHVLESRGDALALIGHGSVGIELERLDEHSDLDFFVIVEDGAKQRYLDAIDWLEELAPVAFDVRNTADGRKVLFADGVYAEYAVFTVSELQRVSAGEGRVVWWRRDAPEGLEQARNVPVPAAVDVVWHLGEALTNLLVGLHRDARGERLSAARLIQQHAVDRLLALAAVHDRDAPPPQDPFAVERGIERRFDPAALPLGDMVPGYRGNRAAARAILTWCEERFAVDPSLASAIRALADDA